jgi:PAS domain S-box-containing protein
METRTKKMAEMILRVTGGARATDIPVENAPVVPVFDWVQLERWGIDESLLPPDSIVRFRVLSFWQLYKARIIAVGCILVLQTVLIGALLVQRRYARRNAAALQESEGRFRNMADTAPVLIWVSGPDKLCTFFNSAWLTFAGRGMEQELGNKWEDRIHPSDRSRWSAVYSSSFDSRSAFQIEYRLRRSDGEYRWLLCAGAPRFQQDGAFAGYVGSNLDITDLKRAQERALAGQKLESIGLLANGIAHDFNNLLSGILISAELALMERATNTPCDEELLRIKAAAVGGAQIVRELMNFGAKGDPVFEPLDCSKLVREMVQVLKFSISKYAVLQTDLADDLDMIRGNAAQVRQLIMNLVINASQAIGDREGEIRISTKRLPPDQSESLAREANLPQTTYLQLEVADTGPGITEDIKARIFDPFFSTKPMGRGLGLAVVQHVVQEHNGAIKVMTAPGAGTVFQVMLPCVPKGELAREEPGADHGGAAGNLPGATVLIIEDEVPLRTSVSKLLRSRGYSVLEAGDGKTGVDLFRAWRTQIALVLLDMTLPVKSGAAVLQELHQIRPGIRVIVTSAYGREHVRDSLNGLGYWGYIQKPYPLTELEKLLRRCSEEAYKQQAVSE